MREHIYTHGCRYLEKKRRMGRRRSSKRRLLQEWEALEEKSARSRYGKRQESWEGLIGQVLSRE